jgi:hypothetical protein
MDVIEPQLIGDRVVKQIRVSEVQRRRVDWICKSRRDFPILAIVGDENGWILL